MNTDTDQTWRDLYRAFLIAQNDQRKAHTALMVVERDWVRGLCTFDRAQRAAGQLDRATSAKYKTMGACIQYRVAITQPASGPDAGDPQTERS